MAYISPPHALLILTIPTMGRLADPNITFMTCLLTPNDAHRVMPIKLSRQALLTPKNTHHGIPYTLLDPNNSHHGMPRCRPPPLTPSRREAFMQAGRPPSDGRSNASKTSSHASFSRRSSASGTQAAGAAATQLDTSEIQPTRSVSEDSDSEGGTLFQPIRFSEHVQVSEQCLLTLVPPRSTYLLFLAAEKETMKLRR